jgi:putative ABC transport system permease protein
VIAQEHRIAAGLRRVSADSLPLRVGLAYPLARRFRTAMTLGMFSIVVLTLVFMSQLSLMFSNRSGTIANDLSGGFGAVVTANPSNPIPVDELAQTRGVHAVAPLIMVQAIWDRPSGDAIEWPLTGYDRALVAAPPRLVDRGRFASDRAAWEAVRTDPSLVIVDKFFATTSAGPPVYELEPGSRIRVTDRVSGNRRALTVAAIATDDYLASGAYMGADGLRALFGEQLAASRYYVNVDSDATLAAIRDDFVANGAEVSTVRALVEELLKQTSSFFTLMQQFVGVGLIIGIAGIGVILIRAVRERRRQIGVLRALGFSKRMVARSFLAEASFVATAGTLIGVAIALVATWGLTTTGASWTRGFEFDVAWRSVGGIVALAIVAAMVAAVLPARAASDIRPAVALRVAD